MRNGMRDSSSVVYCPQNMLENLLCRSQSVLSFNSVERWCLAFEISSLENKKSSGKSITRNLGSTYHGSQKSYNSVERESIGASAPSLWKFQPDPSSHQKDTLKWITPNSSYVQPSASTVENSKALHGRFVPTILNPSIDTWKWFHWFKSIPIMQCPLSSQVDAGCCLMSPSILLTVSDSTFRLGTQRYRKCHFCEWMQPSTKRRRRRYSNHVTSQCSFNFNQQNRAEDSKAAVKAIIAKGPLFTAGGSDNRRHIFRADLIVACFGRWIFCNNHKRW